MIVTCYAHLISMARISKKQCHQCLTYQTIYGPFALPTKTVLNALSVTATENETHPVS
jgi:hypothetical protein